MRGFVYKGKHSLIDYNIVAKSIERPVLPTLRKSELAIPGHHGVYDFGFNTFDKRIISVLLQYDGETVNEMRLNTRQIATWISSITYEHLTFDDEPDKYYLAKCYDSVGLETFFRLGIAPVQFECQPFALYQATTGEDILLDSNLPLDSDILLNPVELFSINITENTSFDIDYWGTQEVEFGSPTGSKFDITITGSFTSLSIALNGKTINYNEPMASKTVTIDNINAIIKTDGFNKLAVCAGDLDSFLKLVPGLNTATITGVGMNCTVLFDFRPQYL